MMQNAEIVNLAVSGLFGEWEMERTEKKAALRSPT
jgi:hypothetical protein